MEDNDCDINTITQSLLNQSDFLKRSIITMSNEHRAEIAELEKNNCELRDKLWQRTELAVMAMLGWAIAAVPLVFYMLYGC